MKKRISKDRFVKSIIGCLFLVLTGVLVSISLINVIPIAGAITVATPISPKLYAPLIIQDDVVTPTPVVPPDGNSSWSSPIALSPDQSFVWVVNPDSNSITKVNVSNPYETTEIPVPQEPWSMALAPDGSRVYVAARADGVLTVLNAQTHAILASLPIGPEPTGIALNPTGSRA